MSRPGKSRETEESLPGAGEVREKGGDSGDETSKTDGDTALWASSGTSVYFSG